MSKLFAPENLEILKLKIVDYLGFGHCDLTGKRKATLR